jgi:uncharacterized protein
MSAPSYALHYTGHMITAPGKDGHKVMRRSAAYHGLQSLRGMIADSEKVMLTFMQWVSRTPPGKSWKIDSEICDMSKDQLGQAPVCSFIRYNVVLDEKWLEVSGWTKTSAQDLTRMREMTNPAPMRAMSEMSACIAKNNVADSDFPPAFDLR